MPLGSLRQLGSRRVLKKIEFIVKDFEPDVIHAHMYGGEVVTFIASYFSRAYIVTTRHSAGLEFGGYKRLIARAIKSRFDLLIAVSREAAEEAVSHGYRSERIVTVPNAIDSSRFKPFEGSALEERKRAWLEQLFGEAIDELPLVIGSVGGLKEVKNFELFIRMAARLGTAKDRGGIKYVLLGEGKQRERLAGLARKLGIESDLAMPGFNERTEEVLPLLDIFVLPSLSEGVPLALLEAMSCGIPCIASDVGGVGEALGSGGILVACSDEEGFYKSAAALAGDPSMRRELGTRARSRVVEQFDVSRWGATTTSLYRNLAAARSM